MLIGILLGHWLFGATFTATSMIGFIALAAMIGAAVILFDPIFQGLAISLLFGLDAAHRARDPGDLRRTARRRPTTRVARSSADAGCR
jgi:hypothetical protein